MPFSMKTFIEIHERVKTSVAGEEVEVSVLRYIRASDIIGLQHRPDGRHQLQFWEWRGSDQPYSSWITIDEPIGNVARDIHDALTAKDDMERFSMMMGSFLRDKYIRP
jgi:hypothetical protein